jgi:hypothetical protein
MKLISNYKEAAAILRNSYGRELREIAEHKEEIIELCKDNNVYTADETDIFVAQLSGSEGNELYAYELVDFYLSCDTDSEIMTEEEITEFERIGGEIRG